MKRPASAIRSSSSNPARKDKEQLQGAWTFVSGRREAQLLVAGDHFAVKFKRGDIYMGTFKLHPTQEPKQIDMIIQEGPDRHKGKTSRGIYELDGDRLRWCPAEPGAEDRRTTFPAAADPRCLDFVFQREPRSAAAPEVPSGS